MNTSIKVYLLISRDRLLFRFNIPIFDEGEQREMTEKMQEDSVKCKHGHRTNIRICICISLMLFQVTKGHLRSIVFLPSGQSSGVPTPSWNE